jgi:hypothetical protein
MTPWPGSTPYANKPKRNRIPEDSWHSAGKSASFSIDIRESFPDPFKKIVRKGAVMQTSKEEIHSVVEIRKRIFKLESKIAALPENARQERLALEACIEELWEEIRDYVF